MYLVYIDVAFTADPNEEHFHLLIICDKTDKANISDNNNDFSLLLVTYKTSIYTHILYSVTYIIILFLLFSKGPVTLLFNGMIYFARIQKTIIILFL